MGYLIQTLGPLPAPGTLAEPAWIDRAAAHLLALCPVQRTGRTIYIQQDTNGSATGAISGSPRDGNTPATAYGVRHTADLATLITAEVDETDTTILLRRGDVFRMDASNILGSQVDFPAFDRCTLASYRGTGTAGADDVGTLAKAPQIRGTLAPFNGGWTVSNTLGGAYAGLSANMFHRAVSQVVYHCLFAEDDQVDGGSFGLGSRTIRWWGRLGTGTTPTITAQLAAMDAIDEDAAVYDVTNGRLHVRSRSARTATFNTASRIEAVISSTRGLSIPDVDLWRVDGIALIGWGMDSPVGVSQKYPLHATHTGNKRGVATNNIMAYSGHHAYGQLLTSAGLSGGTTLFMGNATGFCQGDGTGNSTAAVAYAQAGLNEALYVGERLIAGNLRSINIGTLQEISPGVFAIPGTGTTAAPRGLCDAWYAHAGANQPPPDLCVLYRCVIDEAAMRDGGSTVALGGSDGRGDNQPRPNAELSTSWGKSRVVQCIQPPGPLAALSMKMDTAYVSCELNATFPVSGTLATTLGNSNNNVLIMACRLTVDATNRGGVSATFLDVISTDVSTTPAIWLASSHVRIICQPNTSINLFNRFRTLSGFTASGAVNTVFAVERIGPATGTDKCTVGLPDQAPAVGGTGGMSGCAYFGCREVTRVITPVTNVFSGYSATDRPTTLFEPWMSPNVSAVVPHISWMLPQVDVMGRPSRMTIVGALPPAGWPDRNAETSVFIAGNDLA